MENKLKGRVSLNMKDAAAYCHMSYPVFRDWFLIGIIPSVPSRPGSTRRLIVVERLDEFLEWLESDEASNIKSSEKS